MAETTTYVPRLKTKYRDEIRPKLLTKFKCQNVHQVGRLEKIIVSMGVGATARDRELTKGAVRGLATVIGQEPVIDRAYRSIVQFKLCEESPIGAHMTLRDNRMWEFLDRLLATTLSRTRDFRGLSTKQFDGHGNYTFGLTEQPMFHEIDQDTIDHMRGMDITAVTAAATDDEGHALLKYLGFPFKKD